MYPQEGTIPEIEELGRFLLEYDKAQFGPGLQRSSQPVQQDACALLTDPERLQGPR